MNKEEREKLRALHEAATGGNWYATLPSDESRSIVGYMGPGGCYHTYMAVPRMVMLVADRQIAMGPYIPGGWDQQAANAAHAASAHNALPALLADSERAEALESILRKLVEFIEEENAGDIAQAYYGPGADIERSPGFTALLTEARAMLDTESGKQG